MADLTEGLIPDRWVLAVQGGVFLVSLGAAQFFLVRPLLRLSQERKLRTDGKRGEAQQLTSESQSMREKNEQTIARVLAEARAVRLGLLAEGKNQARQIMQEVDGQARRRVEQTVRDLDDAYEREKDNLPKAVTLVARSMLVRLTGGAISLLVLSFFSFVLTEPAYAGAGGFSMESIGWPYFQFLIFLAVLIWAGGKFIPSMLAERRSRLEQDLAEARQALAEAQRTLNEHRQQTQGLEQECKDLLERYREEGVHESERIVAGAHRLAEQILRDAERSITDTVSRRKAELQQNILDLAAAAVKEQLRRSDLTGVDALLRQEVLVAVRKSADLSVS